VSSESIPVLSSVFLTGNDYPDQEALITRVIWEEMNKKDFSDSERKDYEILSEMYRKGVSHLTVQILNHRQVFEDSFKQKFSQVYNEITHEMIAFNAQPRILQNISVLATTYELLKDVLQFPFGWQDIVEHYKKVVETQMRKCNTASIENKWWDCFLSVVRTMQEPLRLGLDFNITDNRLFFNWTNTYNRVAPQWYRQYGEIAPGKGKIRDLITDNADLQLQKHASHRFAGSSGSHTSAWSVELKSTGIQDEMMEACDYQKNYNLDKPEQSSQNGLFSPATPNKGKDGKDELPF
jgi:hypothetical protein